MANALSVDLRKRVVAAVDGGMSCRHAWGCGRHPGSESPNATAAKRLLRKLLKNQGTAPRVMIIDKLASYAAAKKVIMPFLSAPGGGAADDVPVGGS